MIVPAHIAELHFVLAHVPMHVIRDTIDQKGAVLFQVCPVGNAVVDFREKLRNARLKFLMVSHASPTPALLRVNGTCLRTLQRGNVCAPSV